MASLIILVNNRYEKYLSFFKIWAQRFSWILMPNVKFKCWMDSIVLTQYFSDPFHFLCILIQGHTCLDKSYWAVEKSRTRWKNSDCIFKPLIYKFIFQESHNIFSKLNHDEYRQVLGNIKHCILATDLALFFPNKARLSNILKEDAFSWDLPDHRYGFF